jgi:type I restriction enzyme S subunit
VSNSSIIKLEKVIDILDNQRIPVSKKERENRQGEIPYYGATGIAGYIDDYIFDEELVLLGEDGAPFLDYRKNVAWIINGKSWVNNHAHVLRGKKNIVENRYLMYFLNSFDYTDFVTGTTRLKLNQGRLKDIDFPLRSYEEQCRISNKVETIFRKIIFARKKLLEISDNLKIYKESILKEAFEGHFSHSFRERNIIKNSDEIIASVKENSKILFEERMAEYEKGKIRKPKLKQYSDLKIFEDLDELPDEWSWVTIEYMAKDEAQALKAGPFGSSLKKEFYVPKGFKIYGQEQVINNDPYYGDYYINEERYNSLISNKVVPGDILISLVGTVGRIIVLPDDCEPGIINPRLVKLSLDPTIVNFRFFEYYFASTFLKSMYKSKVHGATMDVLNLSMIKELPFPLCSIKEQEYIVSYIDSALQRSNELNVFIEDSLEKLILLKRSVLKKAFEGCLVEQSAESVDELLQHVNEIHSAALNGRKKRKVSKKKSKKS